MKILCIGRNYVAHAKELGNEVPQEPVIFIKPSTALAQGAKSFSIPSFSSDLHYECEIVLRISQHAKQIAIEKASQIYDALTVGIDFTARDVQQKLKDKGLPWEKAKAFDQSAVLGDFLPVSDYDLSNLTFTLKINGNVVQNGCTVNMLHSIPQIIEHTSMYFTLKIGDLIFTGTPEGVGKVNPGDVLEGFIEGKKVLNVKIK